MEPLTETLLRAIAEMMELLYLAAQQLRGTELAERINSTLAKYRHLRPS